jgi:hypothetical protein
MLQLGIILIALHNGEEALTMPEWMRDDLPAVTRRLGIDVRPLAVAQLYRGLIAVTIVPALIVIPGSRGAPLSPGIYGSLFVYAVFFWNALVPHITVSVFVRGYSPGVLTAVLNFVFATLLFARALREREVTRGGLAFVLTAAAALVLVGMRLLWGV